MESERRALNPACGYCEEHCQEGSRQRGIQPMAKERGRARMMGRGASGDPMEKKQKQWIRGEEEEEEEVGLV